MNMFQKMFNISFEINQTTEIRLALKVFASI